MAAKTEPQIEARVVQEQIYLAWTAPARPHHALGKQVMTVPLVITGLIGLILLVAGEWMLIVVVASLVFAYYAWSMIPAELMQYQITSRGVRVGGSLYEWPIFTRWWAGDKWGQPMLFLETPQSLTGQLVLTTLPTDKDKIDKIMSSLLLKDKPAATGLDKTAKWLAEKFPLEQKI